MKIMLGKMIRYIMLIFLLPVNWMALPASAGAAEVVYVSTQTARIMSGPRLGAKPLALLKPGSRLIVLVPAGKRDKWLEVLSEQGITGWMYRGHVTVDLPEQIGEETLLQHGEIASQSSAIDLTEADSRRSARFYPVKYAGREKTAVSEPALRYARRAGHGTDRLKALKGIIIVNVEQQEIETFLTKQNVGEFHSP